MGECCTRPARNSAEQVRLRARRLGLLDGPAGEAIQVLPEREIGAILEAAHRARPAILVVDSVQTATVDALEGAAGSVGQVREATVRLMEFAKGEGIAVLLVGHVTKDGSIAGPKTLEHLVDAVVTMEGERYAALRLVRATKNRFGSTDEVGVFEMAGTGLIEVSDPSQAFLGDHPDGAPGSVVAPTLEGSRPILVEVQALVAPAGYGTPARKASGIDPNRLGLLVAVLGRRAGVALGSHDVYANLAGGLAVGEPGMDLPIALALASSLRDRAVGGGRRRHRRGRAARRTARGERPRATPQGGGSIGLPGRHRPPGRARCAIRSRSTDWRSSRSRRCATPSRPASRHARSAVAMRSRRC